jgi:hypothetical protein
MSISSNLAKILKQAGVDPHLYDTDRPGFRRDFQPIHRATPDDDGLDDKKSSATKKKPKALDVGPLEEFHDPQSRTKAITSQDEDRALKLIFQWTKSGSIDFEEFEDLLAEVVRKISPKL